jgi:hypothetical protein
MTQRSTNKALHKTNKSTMLKANNISNNGITKHMKQKNYETCLILDRNKIQIIQQACSIVGREKKIAMMSTMVELKDTTPSQCHQ